MSDRSSVAVAAARWRAWFLVAFGVLQLLKLTVAARLAPFVDEAFYWQESRHPAWGYSDLPPMTAWLIRGGETVAGHGVLGMRWPFLVLGALLPWVLVGLGRRLAGPREGWQAGLACLALPLAGSLGVLALPDVPLTLASAVALLALLGAMREGHWRHWLVLGLALAVAWATHYRAAMLMLAGLVLLVATPRGRGQWRRPGLWVALAVASTGLLPLLVSNLRQDGAGLRFQLLVRNPWSFHADALVQPLEQALVCSPLLYALLLWVLWQCLRRWRQGGPWDVLGPVAASFLVGYLVFGLFADDTRFRVHWPLPGYLPLLAALPVLLTTRLARRRWRIFVAAAFVMAAAGQLSIYAWMGAAASGRGLAVLEGLKVFPKDFVGWRRVGAEARRQLAGASRNALLVADNFKLGAELAFQLNGNRPVYVLDSPLNAYHGRAPQLAAWGLDEAGLRAAHAGDPVVLVVDETALRARQQPDWLGSICARVADAHFLGRLDLSGGERRFAFYAGRVPATVLPASPRDACVVWRQAWSARNTPQVHTADRQPVPKLR